MSRWLLASMAGLVSGAVCAQTPGQPAGQVGSAGSAAIASRLQAQGYRDVHGLRPASDGRWVGHAVRNGVPVTVTSDRAGITIAR